MSRRYICKRGRPSWPFKDGVLSDKPKQQGGQNGHEGVGWVIVPAMQVTTAEGRTQGTMNLGREIQARVDKAH